MTIKEFFSFKKNRFFWINLLAMIIVAGVLVFVVLKALDSYTRHGQAIIVPDAKGKTVHEAQDLFGAEGLQCIVTDSMYVKEKPAGSILEHVPSSGQKVKEGRVIYLTINTLNVPTQIIPDVADNSSLRQAEARLLAAGFKLTKHEPTRGERDWVYNIKYKGRVLAAGERVPVGSTLTLVVGDGAGESFESDSTVEAPVIDDGGAADESWF
ncbi:PASTA domain-containing protein [Bacteroides sp. 51]|uniref:PASTA domain-containing protein n=1 Tax=Bacteroides sp. 51 TaxID=2302938 RepID=UPI0013D34C23|nr:PASTA domain-containing protein [Bacteroides sp. 51]NDV83938.1 PASTA domain-containing protein [Bacteroides sp. 51]